jgi:hypothetical protein
MSTEWIVVLSSAIAVCGTVLVAVIGILAATVPAFINSKTQKEILEIETQKKRHDALTNYAIELVQKDIGVLENAIDSAIISLRDIYRVGKLENSLKALNEKGEITKEELDRQIKEASSKISESGTEIQHSIAKGAVRGYSLRQDITDKYLEFDRIVDRLHSAMTGKSQENQPELWTELWITSGELKSKLRDYLVEVKTTGKISL